MAITSNIMSLYTSGEDALQNMWNLSFQNPTIFDADIDAEIRSESFTIPESTIAVYEIVYDVKSFYKMSGQNENPSELSFTIRLDRYLKIYESLFKWQQLFFDTEAFVVHKDPRHSELKCDLIVNTYNEEVEHKYNGSTVVKELKKNKNTQQWEFYGIYPKSIPEIPFDYSAGDPLKLGVTLGFTYMKRKRLGE